jgi:hypothetical protein
MERAVKWVEGGLRSISIDISSIPDKSVKIFAYDFSLQKGIHVDSLDDLENLDFKEMKKQEELKLLRELQSKYAEERQA